MIAFILWIALSVLAGVIAGNKGRSSLGLFLVAILLSPLVGIIVALCLSPNETIIRGRQLAEGGHKVCPFCAETIKRAAIVCPHCQRDLAAQAGLVPPPAPGRRAPKIEVASKGENLGAMSVADIQAKVRAGELDLVDDFYLDPESNEWQPLGVLVEA